MSDLIRPGDPGFHSDGLIGEVLPGNVVTLSIRPVPGTHDTEWECFDTKSGRPVGWRARGITAIRGRRNEVELATRALCEHEAFRYQQPDRQVGR